MNYTRNQIINSKSLTLQEKNQVLDYFGYNRLPEYRPVTVVTAIETRITNLYIY